MLHAVAGVCDGRGGGAGVWEQPRGSAWKWRVRD